MSSVYALPYFNIKICTVRRRMTVVRAEDGPKRKRCELLYKLSGRSEQTIDGATFEFLPDMVLFIPKGKSNHAEITEEGQLIGVNFEADLPDDTEAEYMKLAPNNPIKELFFKLERAAHAKSGVETFESASLLYAIFAELTKEREKRYLGGTRYALIEPAAEYIKAHYRERIDVEKLAGLCSLSSTYLRRLFKHYFGRAPLDYIMCLRLEHGRDLLKSGVSTVGEAARSCGFENEAYFSRQYKKHYGETPGSTLSRARREFQGE